MLHVQLKSYMLRDGKIAASAPVISFYTGESQAHMCLVFVDNIRSIYVIWIILLLWFVKEVMIPSSLPLHSPVKGSRLRSGDLACGLFPFLVHELVFPAVGGEGVQDPVGALAEGLILVYRAFS